MDNAGKTWRHPHFSGRVEGALVSLESPIFYFFFFQQIDADDTVVQAEFVPSDGRILPKLLENICEDCFKLQD